MAYQKVMGGGSTGGGYQSDGVGPPVEQAPWAPLVPPPPELNAWQTGLLCNCFSYPGTWCAACWCAPCFAYKQRERILQEKWDAYVCCDGMFCGDKVPMQQSCPSCCACMEAFCCLRCAMLANRGIISRKYHIRERLIEKLFIFCCSGGANLSVGGGGDDQSQCSCPVDPVSGCALTQIQVEMNQRSYPYDSIAAPHSAPPAVTM